MNESIITKEELDYIFKFINANEHLFTNTTAEEPNFTHIGLYKDLNPPQLFFDIKDRILDKENIASYEEWRPDESAIDYIGRITAGGCIPLHKDYKRPGYDTLRFQLILSVPEKGGLPIYGGKTIPVKVGDYVRCDASRDEHEVSMVEGDIPRIVISYGVYVESEYG